MSDIPATLGYTYLGPVAIPPYPQFAGLVDRVTGATRWLQYDPGTLAISTTTTPAPAVAANGKVWGAQDGPMIGDSGRRLFSSSGTVGTEVPTKQPTYDYGPPVWAFRSDGVMTNVGQVTVGATGALAITVVTL